MTKKHGSSLGVLILIILVTFTGCASLQKNQCHIVYDAGSSGTRLHIYEKQNGAWVDHAGPKAGALADPVRGIRGKSWTDADGVVEEVIGLLEKIKTDGPEKKGAPKWAAFDWPAQCNVATASVYATAGMRIAEQENPTRSAALWAKLKKKLAELLGRRAHIDARTLAGFEEGLYAWLSVRQKRGGDGEFGIVEMGGASSQLTFPCVECPEAREVETKKGPLKMFSYSFLGLGVDEAYKLYGKDNPACNYGAGVNNPGWTAESCASSIRLKNTDGVIDPYNRVHGDQEARVPLPAGMAAIDQWVLTGGFTYAKEDNIEKRCRGKEKCYDEKTACFRAVYYPKYLQILGVASKEKSDSSWTLGAVICKESNCLGSQKTLRCHWRPDGACLGR